MAEETLTGRVTRILFQDEAEAFAVFDVEVPGRGKARVAGHALDLKPGLHVRVTGDWRDHPRFGRQLRATTVMVLPPERPEAIAAYLASGRVEGIGRGLAQRLVAFFGPRLREVLDGDVEGLRECPGIGPQRAQVIHEAWHRQRRERETYVLLAGFGLTQGQILKVVRAYGEGAPARIQENPYDLVRRVPGIGFRTADTIAEKVGVPRDASVRLLAAVRYVLAEASESGHVFLSETDLARRVADLTGQDEERARAAISEAESQGSVIAEVGPPGRVIYDRDLYRVEVEVASRLRVLCGAPVRPLQAPEGHLGSVVLAPSQREAVATLTSSAVSVLTGGPGTGKTTVVGALLALARRAHLKVMLAAPTGRAAMRMREATGVEARTIHRLLEFNPRTGQFARDALNPLDADWVVVDEASMLDIVLLGHLLRALTPGTRLTLVGDADQLPPVGPGDPFRDLIASGTVPVARLREVFRQGEGSAIVHAAHEVLSGREPKPPANGLSRDNARAFEVLRDFYIVFRDDPTEVASVIERLVVERIPTRFGLNPLRDVQVLAPMHRGDCGTEALNRRLRARLNPSAAGRPGLQPGDRVIQTRNNYTKEVFNGDIGLVLDRRQDGTVRVQFEDRLVDLDPSDAEDLTLAYAISVHKAQGSEFSAVVVSLHTQHYMMLRRNLLYTAITRGRRLCVLVGNRRAVRLAVANDRIEVRNTGLAQRLREALPTRG